MKRPPKSRIRALLCMAGMALLQALPAQAQYQLSGGAFNDLSPVSRLAQLPGSQGLRGNYYNSSNLTGQVVLTRDDSTLNFSWSGSPGPGVNADQFSVRWTGFINIPTDGDYTFFPRSDDGVRLWINGAIAVNEWRDQGATEFSSGPIRLSPGLVPIVVEFYDNAVVADIDLRWEGPGISKEIIPTTSLVAGDYETPTGDPVTFPAIAGQSQGPNVQSVAATTATSAAISDTGSLTSRFPSQIYRDGNGQATGAATILLQSELGYSFASGVPRYFMGDVIDAPLVRSDSITPAPANYWRGNPVEPGEIIPHTTGGVETPISANAELNYYYSPHAKRVFATQPGVVTILWVSRLPEAGRYQFRSETFSVSNSTRAPVRKIYWTEREFKSPAVIIPTGRITRVNPIYSPFFPESVASEYLPPGTTRNPNAFDTLPEEKRTLWVNTNNPTRTLRAYNIQGRIFVEYLGALNQDGVTYQFLGADIIEVEQAAPDKTLVVNLGEQILPEDGNSELYASPLTQENINPLYGSTTRPDGRVVYYAERENANPDNVQFYWLEALDAGIYTTAIAPGIEMRWPKYLNKYLQIWPSDPAEFAQLVLPSGGSTPETGVFFGTGGIPQIVWQDDGSLTEASIDVNSQTMIVKPGDGRNRSLLRFISGNEFWYVRINAQTELGVQNGNVDGTAFDATATVGDRIERPSASYELGGYIASGTGYNADAYLNPYAAGVAAAGSGSIIPVNAVPGNNQISVWWFRKINPPNANFTAFHVASRLGRYTLSYPSASKRIVMASNQGSGDLSPSEIGGSIYIQNNPALHGYNPNEEHAMLIAGRVYALRDDLNLQGASASTYTSAPFALLSYISATDGRPSMTAFKIEREDSLNKFDYIATAGTILQGPMPLPILPPALDSDGKVKNTEVTPESIDPRPNTDAPVLYDKFTYEDRKGYHWVYRGPHAGAGAQRLEFKFYYPMQQGFFIPGLSQQPVVGTALPYLRPLDGNSQPVGDAVTGDALVIKYQPVWPTAPPELRVAETLTLPKFGLPSVRGQTSAEVLYQQSVAVNPAKPAAVLHDPTREKSIALDSAAVGLSKLPASALTTGSFGKIYFQLIPPHLQERFYFDPLLGSKGSLVLRGEFVNEIAGEDYLHLNVLSDEDEARLKGIVLSTDTDKAKWNAAIDALNTRVETFIENPARRGTYIVDSSANRDVGENDLASVSNSDTAVDSYALTATGQGDGYVTLLFGDGEAFTPKGEPVSMQVIKVAPQLYTGDLKVLLSGNPLDEQVTLRHSCDFAAKPEDYEFEWRYAPPQDGVAPPTYLFSMQTILGGSAPRSWKLQRNPSSPTGSTLNPTTSIVRVTGAGTSGGLDLTGNFRYAFNVGTNGAAGLAGDAYFSADDAPGITLGATDEIQAWNTPNFGTSAADDTLEKVFSSIRWSNTTSLTANLANLTIGRRYKLQLLFGEASAEQRTFDILVEGSLVANDFKPAAAQGSLPLSTAGSALVHEFTATDTTLNVVLDGSDVLVVPGLNRNPILNGVTLEELTVQSDVVTLPQNIVIHDSSYAGGALPGIFITHTNSVDFSAGVPQQLVLSAELPTLDGIVVYINGVPALASNAPAGFENTASTSGLSPSGLTRQWSLAPGFFSKGLNTIGIALYTNSDVGAPSPIDFRLEASVETDRVAAIGSPWLAPNGTLTNVAVVGGNAASPLGSPLLAMSDNYFTMRYRPKSGNVAGTGWSRWMPAKLVEGWIKRVLAGINPFNQRVQDLLNNPVNTDVSLLTQAGTRWEGDVALNLENIDDFGLIEIYETVLKRGKGMSIDSGYDYAPANDALLLAAGYLNDLYNILGNEAYADAANPTISIDDQTTITEVNTSRFAFEGQVAAVLDEELSLLRGRDDFLNPGVAVAPAYNRLYWNYTRGINSGEALYAVNYNIQEKAGSPTADGVLDAADAQRMFPQGHGDAYGHYLTALKGYYYLLQNPNFTWTPRSEAVTVLGQAVQIDYFDERKFARAAANVARSAEQILALTHRQNYKDDTTAGWKHFRDGKFNSRSGIIRHQALDEWTSRSTQGALFHWVVGNAILPEKDTNPNHTGVQIIDRSTVPDLNELASSAAKFQNTIDNANAHLNPLGLSPDSIAFDISPSQLTLGQSHFDQVYARALRAVLNAKGSFNQASKMTRLLRNQENQVDDYNAAIVSQERAYVKQLLDIFGTPYTGDIGPGKTYAQGYAGPDLVNWFVVDRATDMVDTVSPVTITVPVPVDILTFTGNSVEDVRKAWADNKKVEQRSLTIQPNRFIQYSDTYRAGGMGQRSVTGRLQQALLDAHQAQLDVLHVGYTMDSLNMRFRREYQLFKEMLETHLKTVNRTTQSNQSVENIEKTIANLDVAALALRELGELADDMADAGATSSIKFFGLATDGGSPATGAIKFAGSWAAFGFNMAGAGMESRAILQAPRINAERNQLDLDLTKLGFSREVNQAAYEYELLFDEMTGVVEQLAVAAVNFQRAGEQVRNVLAEGQALLEDREVFRQRAAAIIQGYRTKDLTFRTFRNEALEEYRTLFDLAGRYTYLATKSYDYETGLLGTEQGKSVLANIVASRSLGDLAGDVPQATTSTLGDTGLAGVMARLQSDWAVAKGRLGINNPDTYGTLFSLRGEAFRILNSPTTTKDDAEWRQLLERHMVRNLMTDSDVATFCAGLRKADGSAVPGILLPFSTTIEQGQNFFGRPLAGGDHTFTPSSFATKIYSVGMCFPGYVGMDPLVNGTPSGGTPNSTSPLALSATPYVYLIPCGFDVMRAPAFGDTGMTRMWNVKDQALPLPFNLGATSFSTTQFFNAQDTLTEQPWILRKHQAFRVVSDAQLFYSEMPEEFTCRRLVGRSAWNTQWKLVIPAYTLLANEQDGLNRFAASVKDIQIFLRTYSHAGN